MIDWIPHLKKNCMSARYIFSPVFESDTHGYNTRVCRKSTAASARTWILRRCAALHENGIRVVLDGVFNHVGRGFFAFRDVQEKRWDSPYKDWFRIDFGGNPPTTTVSGTKAGRATTSW